MKHDFSIVDNYCFLNRPPCLIDDMQYANLEKELTLIGRSFSKAWNRET